MGDVGLLPAYVGVWGVVMPLPFPRSGDGPSLWHALRGVHAVSPHTTSRRGVHRLSSINDGYTRSLDARTAFRFLVLTRLIIAHVFVRQC